MAKPQCFLYVGYVTLQSFRADSRTSRNPVCKSLKTQIKEPRLIPPFSEGGPIEAMKVIVEADSNTGGPYGARGNQTVIVTLSDTTGLLSNITIQIKKNVTNCILYGAKIYEVEMVAGDFP